MPAPKMVLAPAKDLITAKMLHHRLGVIKRFQHHKWRQRGRSLHETAEAAWEDEVRASPPGVEPPRTVASTLLEMMRTHEFFYLFGSNEEDKNDFFRRCTDIGIRFIMHGYVSSVWDSVAALPSDKLEALCRPVYEGLFRPEYDEFGQPTAYVPTYGLTVDFVAALRNLSNFMEQAGRMARLRSEEVVMRHICGGQTAILQMMYDVASTLWVDDTETPTTN